MSTGITSVTVTAAAGSGPAFATRIRYVRFVPGATGSGESVFVIDRSAPVSTVISAVSPVGATVNPLAWPPALLK